MCWHGSGDSCAHGCFEGHFGKCYIRSSRWSKLATSRSFHVKEEVWWYLFRNSVPSTNPSFISLVPFVMPLNLSQFKHIVLSHFRLCCDSIILVHFPFNMLDGLCWKCCCSWLRVGCHCVLLYWADTQRHLRL